MNSKKMKRAKVSVGMRLFRFLRNARAILPEFLAGFALLVVLLSMVLAGLGIGTPGKEELLQHAESSLSRGDFEETVIWARKALRSVPECRDAGMMMVKAYAGMEALGPMVAILDQLAPFDRPVHAPAHLFRAKIILGGRGDSKLIREAATKCLDLAHESLVSHRYEDPVASEVHALRARLFAAAGDWSNAQAALSELAKDGSGELNGMSRHEVLVGIARDQRLSRPGEFRLWMNTLLQALASDPAGLEANRELIAGFAKWRYHPGFLESLREQLAVLRGSGLIEMLDGLEALGEGKENEAISWFEKAHRLNPGNPILSNHLASLMGCRISGADPKRALAIIRAVLEKHPGNSEFLDTFGHILLRLERNQEAAEVLEKALVAGPRAATHLALSEAYTRLGQVSKAKEHQQAALRGDSEGPK